MGSEMRIQSCGLLPTAPQDDPHFPWRQVLVNPLFWESCFFYENSRLSRESRLFRLRAQGMTGWSFGPSLAVRRVKIASSAGAPARIGTELEPTPEFTYSSESRTR